MDITSNTPLKYQTLLEIIKQLPEEQQHYVLKFITAYDKQTETRLKELDFIYQQRTKRLTIEQERITKLRKGLETELVAAMRKHYETIYRHAKEKHGQLNKKLNMVSHKTMQLIGMLQKLLDHTGTTIPESLLEKTATLLDKLIKHYQKELSAEHPDDAPNDPPPLEEPLCNLPDNNSTYIEQPQDH